MQMLCEVLLFFHLIAYKGCFCGCTDLPPSFSQTQLMLLQEPGLLPFLLFLRGEGARRVEGKEGSP